MPYTNPLLDNNFYVNVTAMYDPLELSLLTIAFNE